MSDPIKKCSSCQNQLEKTGEDRKEYGFFLNNKEILVCEKCWEEKKNDYKVKLKAEFEKLEEWERRDKRVWVSISTYNASGTITGHVDLGNLCKECDKWCDQENSGIEFCSPKCRLIIEEKRELKSLQEQWKILKDLPSNYPDRQKTQDRLQELERKYNNNPNKKETIPSSIKEYFAKNKVKSIKLDGDKWIIEYKNSQITTLTNIPELESTKSYFQQQTNQAVSYEQLRENKN